MRAVDSCVQGLAATASALHLTLRARSSVQPPACSWRHHPRQQRAAAAGGASSASLHLLQWSTSSAPKSDLYTPHDQVLLRGLQRGQHGSRGVSLAAGRQQWQRQHKHRPVSGYAASTASGGGSSGSSSQGGSAGSTSGLTSLACNQQSKLVPVPAGLEAQLQPVAAACGCNTDVLARVVAAQPEPRQQGLLQHGIGVAEYLQRLGVGQHQLAPLLMHCPLLFSWPAEQRAVVLFDELEQRGLTAAEAVRCYKTARIARTTANFQPGMEVLLQLFAAAGSTGDEAGGREVLGELPLEQPSGEQLLDSQPATPQRSTAGLCSFGFSDAQLDAVARREWAPLIVSPNRLAAVEPAGKVLKASPELLAKLAVELPLEMRGGDGDEGWTAASLRQRARTLVQEFGREEARAMVDRWPGLLAVHPAVWQAALAMACLLGAPSPAALTRRNPLSIALDWLERSQLASQLAVQRSLRLPPAAVYARFARYVMGRAARLASRLLYLEQQGLLPLLVEAKGRAQREWRLQRGLPPSWMAGEPPFISLRDVLMMSDAQFARLEAVVSRGGSLLALRTFLLTLDMLPAWQRLMAQAEAKAARLAAVLQPEMRAAAAAREARRKEQEGEA